RDRRCRKKRTRKHRVHTSYFIILTSMLLYLMRHGHAEEHHPDGDAGRRLTSYGEQGVRRAAERLRGMGISFDRIIASPYARAMRTATITAGVIGYEGK